MPHRAEELSLLQAQMVYKKRLEAVMQELKNQEASLLVKVQWLERIKFQEQQDLDRLEGGSLASFFYNVIGKRDAQLDKERREAYAARIKYDAARRELEAIQEDIRETEQDLQDLQDCEARYAQKLEQTRLALEAEESPEGVALLEKEQTLTYMKNQEKELEEAIEAGTSALRVLSEVLGSLHRAKDWGSVDILGSGFFTEMARHEKVDEAQRNVEDLQVWLQRFNKELSDVSIRGSLQVSIERMLKFSDRFLDGLTEDLSVMEGIQKAYTQLDMTREQILGMLRQLQNTLEEVRHKQTRLKTEMDNMVLNTGL